jgi:hypothetical protein
MPPDLVAADTHPKIDLRIGHPGAKLAPSLTFGARTKTHLC